MSKSLNLHSYKPKADSIGKNRPLPIADSSANGTKSVHSDNEAEDAPDESEPVAVPTPLCSREDEEDCAEEEPAKEEPPKDVPAKEVPPKEVPAKELPAKEAPAEEAPAKEEPAKEEPAKVEPAKVEPAEDRLVDRNFLAMLQLTPRITTETTTTTTTTTSVSMASSSPYPNVVSSSNPEQIVTNLKNSSNIFKLQVTSGFLILSCAIQSSLTEFAV